MVLLLKDVNFFHHHLVLKICECQNSIFTRAQTIINHMYVLFLIFLRMFPCSKAAFLFLSCRPSLDPPIPPPTTSITSESFFLSLSALAAARAPSARLVLEMRSSWGKERDLPGTSASYWCFREVSSNSLLVRAFFSS